MTEEVKYQLRIEDTMIIIAGCIYKTLYKRNNNWNVTNSIIRVWAKEFVDIFDWNDDEKILMEAIIKFLEDKIEKYID
jgi:hypothetical protein